MTLPKKQLKITKLFRKGGNATAISKAPEDCDELQEEIHQLEQKLREKQTELFQVQRNGYRHKVSPPKQKDDTFVRPQKIIVESSVDSLRRRLEVMSMLSSTEVQSYVANDSCSIVFHMQHDSEYEVKHGLKIDLKNGAHEISACSLPLGFNLNAVLEDFDNVMKPDCLGAIKKALVAYYDRLEQFQALKKLLHIEAELFKTMDGTHMELSFYVQSATLSDEEQFRVWLLLDYRVYDIRPKTYTIQESDLPELIPEALREQCAVFKKKPLRKAFKEAFIDGIGQYKLAQQLPTGPQSPARRRRKRTRDPHPHLNRYDDTFRPDDCSEQSDDDD